MHQRGGPGPRHRVEDAFGTGHVDVTHQPGVVAGLQHPGQVYDDVGAGESDRQVVGGDVRGHPVDPVVERSRARSRRPPGDTDDVGDIRFGLQRGDEGGADVAGRSGDGDTHGRGVPLRFTGQP